MNLSALLAGTDCGVRYLPFPECECCAVLYMRGPAEECGHPATVWELHNFNCTATWGQVCDHPDMLDHTDLCGKVSYEMADRLRAAGLYVSNQLENQHNGIDPYIVQGGGIGLPGSGYRDPTCNNDRIAASPNPKPFLGLEGHLPQDELMFLSIGSTERSGMADCVLVLTWTLLS